MLPHNIGSSHPSLEKISFAAEPGQTIGIIGGTGSGKTTLINLIPRLYDAVQGKVLIEGWTVEEHNTVALRLKKWYDNCGYACIHASFHRCIALVVANFIATRAYSMFKQQSSIRGEQTGLNDETIGNIKVVRAFGHEEASLTQFDEINNKSF